MKKIPFVLDVYVRSTEIVYFVKPVEEKVCSFVSWKKGLADWYMKSKRIVCIVYTGWEGFTGFYWHQKDMVERI